MENNQNNQNNQDNRNPEIILLKIINENQDQRIYECQITQPLEYFLKSFATDCNLDYTSLFVLYGGTSLSGESLKKNISEIINPQDKKEKLMILLVYKMDSNIDEFRIDKITLVVSIESSKIVKLYGNSEDTLRYIITSSSDIIFHIKYCKFEYKYNEIDLNKKFDDIANDEDKLKRVIEITLSYTIPLKVNFINEDKFENGSINCLLQDYVDSIFEKYIKKQYLYKDDYYIFYDNKKIEKKYYKSRFFRILPEFIKKLKKNIKNFMN